MQNQDDYQQIQVNEKIKIEDKWYYVQYLCNFKLEMENFMGYVNIILSKSKKNYRFFYRGGVKEDSFMFHNLQSFLFYFEGVRDISSFQLIPENHHHQPKYIQQDDLFLKNGYTQFIISQDLLHLKNKLKEAYGLDYCQNNETNLLCFGLYNYADLELLEAFDKNNDKKVGILWGGSDIMLKTKLRSRILKLIIEKNYENFAMSDYIWEKLERLGVKNKRKVCVSFCWNDGNYLRKRDTLAKNIFIYDGIGKDHKKNEIYNKKLVDKFAEIVSQKYPIVRTSAGEFIKNIDDIQANSFVSLRLTNYDGNANSAQECGMFGVPVISNQAMNHCVSWQSLEEIVKKVSYIRKNNVRMHWRKDGVNLLFVSNDEIGKGGGATFTFQFKKYLEKRGFNIWAIFLAHHNSDAVKIALDFSNRIIQMHFNTKQKWCLLEKLEKIEDSNFRSFMNLNYTIVLRSYIPMKDFRELQAINPKILFFIPGIFKNALDGDWKTMTEDKILRHLNLANFKIANEAPSFCNSCLTRSIYQKYGIPDVGVLEINLLQMQAPCKKWEDSERNIDYLCVVSDVKRAIKNVRLFYELRKRIPGHFCLISGEKVEKKVVGIEYIETLNHEKLEKFYQRAKILVSPSFFDSMSNTVLEAINCGCFVLISENQGVYVSSDHIVRGYSTDVWEKRCLEVADMWKSHPERVEEIRRETRRALLERSWEVEIRVLELLSKN
jgi:glycosyltransferase involved in cell wall biosynthesis